jgi:hypothetical protein
MKVITMFCPNCKCEYIEGIRECPDCKIALVAELGKESSGNTAENDTETIEAMKPVWLKSAADRIEAELIINLLRNNGIPCFYKDNSAGSYMNLYMGCSVFGQEIFVDDCDYETALKLLEQLPDAEVSDQIGEGEDNKYDKNISFYKYSRLAIRILILASLGISFLFMLYGLIKDIITYK